jgi:methyl coenzyme M reductase subunit C
LVADRKLWIPHCRGSLPAGKGGTEAGRLTLAITRLEQALSVQLRPAEVSAKAVERETGISH